LQHSIMAFTNRGLGSIIFHFCPIKNFQVGVRDSGVPTSSSLCPSRPQSLSPCFLENPFPQSVSQIKREKQTIEHHATINLYLQLRYTIIPKKILTEQEKQRAPYSSPRHYAAKRRSFPVPTQIKAERMQVLGE
jgi:hypothetical protein